MVGRVERRRRGEEDDEEEEEDVHALQRYDRRPEHTKQARDFV